MSTAPPPLPSARKSKSHLIVACVSSLLFVVSLAFPAMHLDNGEVWYGGQVLIWGWLGVFIGVVAWLANPLLIVIYALLLTRRWLATLIISALTVLVASHSLSILNTQIPLDEANVRKAIVLDLGPAFYLWIAALASPGLGALLLIHTRRSYRP